jgi:two-component system response regulator NreC
VTQAPHSDGVYRVLIADEFPTIRRGLRALLTSQPGIEVCGEASNGIELVDMVSRKKPKLVIMGLTMPQLDEVEGIALLRNACQETKILVFTMHCTEDFIRGALAAGAHAYVLKSDPESELLSAVAHLRQNRVFYTSEILKSLTKHFVAANTHRMPDDRLTEREVEILCLLASGNSNKEAARKVNLSTRTVEAHRNHIMRKLNFSSTSELIRFAIRKGFIEL